MLPGGMNGFDVLRKLKGSKETKNTPVVVYTKLQSEKRAAIEEGASDYLVKSKDGTRRVVEIVDQHLFATK